MEIQNLNQNFEVKLETCERITEIADFFKAHNITKCVYTWYRENPSTGKRDIINIGKTPCDKLADVVINDKAGDTMAGIVSILLDAPDENQKTQGKSCNKK